jgi:pseudaminic acid synthase
MQVNIADKIIGDGCRSFIIAEISANHNHDIDRAKKIIKAAANAGADAIKLQTYTPDTLTFESNEPAFQVGGTIWEGKNLYELYAEAHLPWDWHQPLFEYAKDLGLIAFSTPFDFSAVDFLETLDVPAYKIASSELVDLPLIQYVAKTGKPMIISTGMGTLSEIEEAVKTARNNGCKDIILLKCTAAYPALISEANLKTIANMAELFQAVVGLSDHTFGSVAPVVATSFGSRVIEKHLTLSRDDGGPDSAFSMNPNEFAQMVEDVHSAEDALGEIKYEPTKNELRSRDFRRSLFVVKDIKIGEKFTSQNVRSIRPATGLHTKYYDKVLRSSANVDIFAGTALTWDVIG